MTCPHNDENGQFFSRQGSKVCLAPKKENNSEQENMNYVDPPKRFQFCEFGDLEYICCCFSAFTTMLYAFTTMLMYAFTTMLARFSYSSSDTETKIESGYGLLPYFFLQLQFQLKLV